MTLQEWRDQIDAGVVHRDVPHARMPVYENPSPGKDTTMDELAVKFRDYVFAVASGESVNNEKHGRREIAIFKTGVTL